MSRSRNNYIFRHATALLSMALLLAAAPVVQAQAPPAPPPPEVGIITVAPQTLPVSFDFVGVTEASKTVEVRSRVRGFLEERSFEEGAYIEEGTKLFTIDRRSFEADLDIAEARVEQAQTRLSLATQEVERLRSVKVPGAIAESDLDRQLAEQSDAAAALTLAKAQLEKAKLELGYTTIEAPLTGFIGKALKEIGSFVDESLNSLLAEMYQVDPLYVSFQMTERDYLRLNEQLAAGELQTAEGGPYVEVTLLDGSLYPERGAITFEAATVDLMTGSVEMRATFANANQRLKPGQFVTAFLKGYLRPDTIAVPQRAVSQSPQGPYVYAVTAENTAELRPIKPGAWSGDAWIIESGLREGDQVIVEGLIKVQPGIVVNPSPWQPAPVTAEQE
jgi:membrane fusion protein (multidrug efflux system)